MSEKSRADQRMVALGLAPSRARAQSLIRVGAVYLNDQLIGKPGELVPADAALRLTGEDHPWVSRGGVKLAHGLSHFGLSPLGLTALDIGASTGGFTDVLLHGGAAKVYAVDVGHGQLAEKLRQDARVVNIEGCNARALSNAEILEPVQAVVCDASFISLTQVLPAALGLAAPGAWCLALVKPQFEAGRGRVGKGGVVKDEAVRRDVCAAIEQWFAQTGWTVRGLTDSPLAGPAGNREYLIAALKP